MLRDGSNSTLIMNTDPEFTKKIQSWLNTPDAQKDYAQGALLLLQLSGNAIMYHNLSVYPQGHAEFITGKLQQYLDFRLSETTHKEVVAIQKQVDEIVKSHTEFKNPETNPATEFKAGKRADHDSLPDDIRALYVENLDIVHKMRELHLKLRTLSSEKSPCPDSDRYPFLKELISLDKRLHVNWDTYDHFVAQPPVVPEQSPADEPEPQAEQPQEQLKPTPEAAEYKPTAKPKAKSKKMASNKE